MNTLTVIAVVAAAALIAYAAQETCELVHKYNVWVTEKSRSEHRARAYKEVRERRAIEKNREEIYRVWGQI